MLDRNALHRIYAAKVTDGAPTPEEHLAGLVAVAMAARAEMIGGPPTLLATMPSSVVLPETNGTLEIWSGKPPLEPSGNPGELPTAPDVEDVEALLREVDGEHADSRTLGEAEWLASRLAIALRATQAKLEDAYARGLAPAKTYRERAERAQEKCVRLETERDGFKTALENREADLARERERSTKLDAALAKVNGIRNSIIAMQGFNFSEHAYPLVAALNEAGYDGLQYTEARANLGTLIDQAKRAEERAEKAEAELVLARRALAEWDGGDASSVVDGLELPLRIGTADHAGEAAFIGDVRALATVVEELLRREIARSA